METYQSGKNKNRLLCVAVGTASRQEGLAAGAVCCRCGTVLQNLLH